MPASKHDIPEHFPVAVLMECTNVTDNPWVNLRWSAVGVIVQPEAVQSASKKLLKQSDTSSLYLFEGLSVQLYVDQAESYYHNLMMKTPRLFIVCNTEDSQAPEPVLVTASCDEANAYVEVDEAAFSVDLPPEFFDWIETFVIRHYMPIKKKKRKLKNWKAGE